MSSALSIAVSGLTNAVSRATQAASNIANASLTGGNVDQDLVRTSVASTDYSANAFVIKEEQKREKALLDITV